MDIEAKITGRGERDVGKFITDTDIVASDGVEGNLFNQVEKAIELLRTKYLISEIKFEGIYRRKSAKARIQ